MDTPSRVVWADILKIIAMFAVILIHTAGPTVLQYTEDDPLKWWIGNLYDSMSRWCIPVFIMLSGAFLIGKSTRTSLAHFFLRRVRKILLPFIFWSIVYFFWRIHVNREDLHIASFVTMFLREPVYYHLWFIYILLQLYLLTPILGIYANHATRNSMLYFLAVWLVFASVIPTIEFYYNLEIYYSIGVAYSVFHFIGYFLLGHILDGVHLGGLKTAGCLLLFLLSCAVTALGTWIASGKHPFTLNEIFYEYYGFNVVIMSVSLYLFVKNIPLPRSLVAFEIKTGCIRSIASCVPGIYFAHALCIALLKQGITGITFSDTLYHPSLGQPLFAMVVFLISLIFIAVIRKLPLVRYIVP